MKLSVILGVLVLFVGIALAYQKTPDGKIYINTLGKRACELECSSGCRTGMRSGGRCVQVDNPGALTYKCQCY